MGQHKIWFSRLDKLLKIVVMSDTTSRHLYRKETDLSDVHDFDSSQLSCPLVTALCSSQIKRSYFIATMVLIVKQSNLIELLLKWNSHHGWFKEWMNVACYFLDWIGHFRLPKTLTFKMRLSAQTFLWKWVLFAWEWNIISTSNAEHLILFWYRGLEKLRNGPFACCILD